MKGFARIASAPGKTFDWVAKDPDDKEQLKNMKEFGEFLARLKVVWFTAEKGGAEVAQLGPVTKAWHLHFVRKGDAWFLDKTVGGD